jgi:signal transduction histidine kinase/ActR/RegA family two-component response regulator
VKQLLKSLCQRENIPQALSLALVLVVTATSALTIFLLHNAFEEISNNYSTINSLSPNSAEQFRQNVLEQLSIASNTMSWMSSMSLALVLCLGVLLPFAIHKQLSRLRTLNKELQKAKDSADIAAKAKAEFLANMSHEIRTPMNGVLGMTQLALELSPTPQIKECLDTINSCGQGLLGIINDILDLSKIEAGKFSIVPELFNPRSLFELRLKPLELAAQEKHILFVIDVSAQVPQCLVGDSLRIVQILNNLLSNAIKFTPENGNISISVNWEEPSPGRAWLNFKIQDSGIGISPGHLKLIFTPFSQADASTAKRYGGTGLGLSITHRLVQLMGGTITVESQPGRGSTFRVKLPAAGGNLDTAIAQESNGSSSPSPQRLEILVVEDNIVNQKLAQRMLQTRGHTVTVAADGEQAIHAFSQKQFDLILMDCQMPGMDGFQTTRAIRKLEVTASRTIPIIALTASVLDEDRRRCEEAGMDGHLAKPIDFGQLEQLLSRLVQAAH